jgi:hypothetical protein
MEQRLPPIKSAVRGDEGVAQRYSMCSASIRHGSNPSTHKNSMVIKSQSNFVSMAQEHS